VGGPFGTAFARSKPDVIPINRILGGTLAMPLKILVYSDYV
jgi:hypothetical protein